MSNFGVYQKFHGNSSSPKHLLTTRPYIPQRFPQNKDFPPKLFATNKEISPNFLPKTRTFPPHFAQNKGFVFPTTFFQNHDFSPNFSLKRATFPPIFSHLPEYLNFSSNLSQFSLSISYFHLFFSLPPEFLPLIFLTPTSIFHVFTLIFLTSS